MNKTIRIECTGSATINLADLVEFQGQLKHREQSDIDRMARSIIDHGFSFPFYVWDSQAIKYCFDGHGRIKALKQLQAEGWEIPELPIVKVFAKNIKDAKQKLLRMNGRYGDITDTGLVEFIGDLDIDIKDMNLDISTIDESMGLSNTPPLNK
jgi:hypothetical protein